MADLSEMNNENSAAINAAREGVDISKRIESVDIDGMSIPLVMTVDPDSGVQKIEVFGELIRASDDRAAAPRRRRGNQFLTEMASFVDHINRYKSADSVVFADNEQFQLVAVHNENPIGPEANKTGWRDHRSVYTCPRSPEWLAWTKLDGTAQPQEAFADFVEERLEDLTTGEGFPAPTDVLKMARDLLVLTKGTFQRTINPTTGAGTLVCKSETDTGSTVIPRAFLIAIPVFEGGARYQVEARVRFQLESGRPSFSFVLHRRKEIERDAFREARTHVVTETGLALFAGKP